MRVSGIDCIYRDREMELCGISCVRTVKDRRVPLPGTLFDAAGRHHSSGTVDHFAGANNRNESDCSRLPVRFLSE